MDALLSPRRRRLVGALGSSVGVALLGSACAPRTGTGVLRFAGETMGSTFSVRIAGGPFAAGFAEAARIAVTTAFDEVVRRMSTYDAESDIGRFNRSAGAAPQAMSAGTLAVLSRAQAVSAWTGGAFDVTVAPLVGAWGVGARAAPRGALPDPAALDVPLGWRSLVLDAAAGTARRATPGLQLDLSGIAKGYAVDRAAQALEALGATRYMVEAGGEIRTRGLNGEGRPWQIAIERPDAWPQQAFRIVGLDGRSIATSGDYRNCWQLGARRIHHEIDPATRAPSAHGLASVSVVHDDCTTADALATALFVLGAERGLALARERDWAAHFILRGADGTLAERWSPRFAA